jgi:hypothetical protein
VNIGEKSPNASGKGKGKVMLFLIRAVLRKNYFSRALPVGVLTEPC